MPHAHGLKVINPEYRRAEPASDQWLKPGRPPRGRYTVRPVVLVAKEANGLEARAGKVCRAVWAGIDFRVGEAGHGAIITLWRA